MDCIDDRNLRVRHPAIRLGRNTQLDRRLGVLGSVLLLCLAARPPAGPKRSCFARGEDEDEAAAGSTSLGQDPAQDHPYPMVCVVSPDSPRRRSFPLVQSARLAPMVRRRRCPVRLLDL